MTMRLKIKEFILKHFRTGVFLGIASLVEVGSLGLMGPAPEGMDSIALYMRYLFIFLGVAGFCFYWIGVLFINSEKQDQ